MDSLPQEVDGEAWRAELARQHTYLANVVDQACAWTREFHVQTGVELCGNYTSLKSYPLLDYANRLRQLSSALKRVCAIASLQPPPPTWDRTTLHAPPAIAVPGRDPDWRRADYSEGGRYLLMLQPTSPPGYPATAREQWSAALRLASPSVIEREIGVPQLVAYGWMARSEFDKAYRVVHRAFLDSAAATFGRAWATGSSEDGTRSMTVLVSWMKALTDHGCSLGDCDSVLRDIEVVDPQAVADCRAVKEVWSPPTP